MLSGAGRWRLTSPIFFRAERVFGGTRSTTGGLLMPKQVRLVTDVAGDVE